MSITDIDIKKNDKNLKIFLAERNRKQAIYEKYDLSIKALEDALEICDNKFEKLTLSLRIEFFKKKQKKYYVPSMVELTAKRRIKKRK